MTTRSSSVPPPKGNSKYMICDRCLEEWEPEQKVYTTNDIRNAARDFCWVTITLQHEHRTIDFCPKCALTVMQQIDAALPNPD